MTHRRVSVLAVAAMALGTAVAAERAARPAGTFSSITEPIPVTASEAGIVLVSVDAAACAVPQPPCGGQPPEPADAGNSNPVHIVVQLATVRTSSALPREAFDLAVQFAPDGAPAIEPIDCPACFEAREGGTYSFWAGPAGLPWAAGSYFLRIGLREAPTVLPALARIDIPVTAPKPGCDNEPPVAVIAGEESGIQAFGAPGQLVSVLLDGTLSYDPDALPLDRWAWSCGNGSAPQPIGDGSKAVCVYRVQNVGVSYTAALSVADRGTGEIDPQSGNWRCQKYSSATTIAVMVARLQ